MINVWNNQWSKSFVAALVIVLLLLSDVCACIGYFSIVLCEEKIYLKCFFKGKDKTLSVFILQKCHVMCCEIYQYFVWKWIQFCQWILHHIYILLYNNLLVFDIQIQLISQWSLSVWVWLVNVWWLAVETVKVNRSLTALPLDSGATRVKHARFSPVAPDNWDTDPDAPDPGSEMRGISSTYLWLSVWGRDERHASIHFLSTQLFSCSYFHCSCAR